MSIDLRYDREKGILYAIVGEQVTPDEFACAMEEIIHSDEYPPDVATLWDMRALDFRGADSGTARQLVAMRERYPERGEARLAFVVADDLSFGISRMYELLSADLPQKIRVFRDYAEGEQWLMEEDSS